MSELRIWIDIMTPKQALFFTPLVEELNKLGHLTYLTSRHYREVEGLIKKLPLNVSFVGRHGGASLLGKLVASSERIRELADLVPSWAPNLAVHFASPECARVAYGLRISQICISDCPHTVSVNKLTLPLVDHLMTPWVIPYHAWRNYGVDRKKIVRYKALDPAAWLKRVSVTSMDIKELGADPGRKTITVRYEESYASYLLDKDKSWGISVIDALTSHFKNHNIIVLARYDDQILQLAERYGDKILLPREMVDGASLLKASDLFIGMGGTMTMEAALLGVPAVSAYQGGKLYYISYLVEQGLIEETKKLEHLTKIAETLLVDAAQRKWIREKAKEILQKMEDPVTKILSVVERTSQ